MSILIFYEKFNQLKISHSQLVTKSTFKFKFLLFQIPKKKLINGQLFSVCLPSFVKYLKKKVKKTHLSLMFAYYSYFGLQTISQRIENVKLALTEQNQTNAFALISPKHMHIIPTIHDGNA